MQAKKRITQAELKSVLEPYKIAYKAAIGIRRRIELEGVEIESGRLSVTTEGGLNPLREFTDEDPHGALIAGLDVFEQTEPLQVHKPDWRRDWTKYTPDPHGYALIMTAPNQHCETQDVELTREEFIALKAHLAKMRGIAVQEVAHA
ncbi:MAG: hypothetical protein JWO19_4489 [Bryobacterales bacterium]|nr:hypothetical protein [Bryobacterales bacterium]